MKLETYCTLFVTLALVLGATGCPKTKRRTLAPTIPTSGDAEARTRFQEARTEFERDGATSAADFEAIAEEYPDDPIADYARLYAGIASVETGDYQGALVPLEDVADTPSADRGLRVRAQLFLGLARAHLGEYAAALEHLRAGRDAVANDRERALFDASMAQALSHSSQPLASLSHFQRWYDVATPAERVYIIDRLTALARDTNGATAERMYREAGSFQSPVAVVFGVRAAAELRARGEIERARRIEVTIEDTARSMGLAVDTAIERDTSDVQRVAAVLPLTGRRARVGEPAMRGLALASGTFSQARGGDIQPFQLSVHDTRSTQDGARTAFEASDSDRAIAVIGPIDGKSVDAVAAMAHARGLVMISLNVRSGRRARENSPYVFHMLHSAEDRAEALARHAFESGVTRFAVLRPKNGYGRAVGAAFSDEVGRLGATVTRDVEYDPRATSFGDVIGKLGKDFQVVFIPEQAKRLELIAPALAAADLRVRPLDRLDKENSDSRRRRRARKPGRAIGLLSTAELVDLDFLRSAARYSEGAVLAPGFFPDRDDATIRDFVERFEIAFEREPTPLDAYAHDAARLVRTAVERDAATNRVDLARSLSEMRLTGLTGEIVFGDKHRRADDGLLYQVRRTRSGYTIRALR